MSSFARTAYYVPPDRRLPVWVDLDILYQVGEIDGPLRDDDQAQRGGDGAPQPDGLVVRGEALGFLHRWLRSTDGRWLAQVSFVVPYATGITPGLPMTRVLLPRAAVRPREGKGRGPAATARSFPPPER